MPFALMDKEEATSFSGSDSQSPQNWGRDQPDERNCHRRQRNRDAARKSRKKQTERADVLHEELQTLERSNCALVKEISELEKELQCYTTALKEHEPQCTLSRWSRPSLPNLPSGGLRLTTQTQSTSDLPQLFNPNPEEPILPMPNTNSQDITLDDLLDWTDRMSWESEIRPF